MKALVVAILLVATPAMAGVWDGGEWWASPTTREYGLEISGDQVLMRDFTEEESRGNILCKTVSRANDGVSRMNCDDGEVRFFLKMADGRVVFDDMFWVRQ